MPCSVIKISRSASVGFLRDGLEPIVLEHLLGVLQGLVLDVGLQAATRKHVEEPVDELHYPNSHREADAVPVVAQGLLGVCVRRKVLCE